MTHPNPSYDLVMHQADNSGEGHYPFPDVVSLREPLLVHEVEGNLPANRTIDERMDRVPEPVLAQTPAVLHYPKSREVIQLISGTNILERSLGFNCRAIAIQNLGTNTFIWCQELGIYLTAGATIMNIINIPSGIDNISLQWHTAAFNPTSPVAVAGQYANIWLFDDWVMPEIGASGSGGGGGSAITTFPVAAAALADATANPTEFSIGSQNFTFNGATWDRMRSANGDAQANTGLAAAALMAYNGATFDRVQVDANKRLLTQIGTPAAAALADALANPTTVVLEALMGVYNGATWDRLREITADASAVTGFQAIVQALYNGATFDRMRSANGDAQAATGLAAAALMGYNGATWDRILVNSAKQLVAQVVPAISQGLTQGKLVSAASTNATSLKASAGMVYSIAAFNLNASARYLKLYNKASAPTVGTDTPTQTYLIPPNSSGFVIEFSHGLEFTTGIAYALTTGITDADTGAVAASEIVVNFGYK